MVYASGSHFISQYRVDPVAAMRKGYRSEPNVAHGRLFVLQRSSNMRTDSLGEFEQLLLLAIVHLGDEAYGLGVRRDVSERLQHDYSVGAIYTTLQRLEGKKLVTSRATEPLPVRGGRSRRQFRVTTAGARALREAQRIAASVWQGASLRPESA